MDYFEHYRRVNDLSEEGRRSHWKALRGTLGLFLPENKCGKIIDVGCGAGIVLEWLRDQGYSNAIGFDCDQGQVDFCGSLGLNAERVDDTESALLQHRNVELVIFKDVLEHIAPADVEKILLAARKALSPQGLIYVAVPNAASSFATYWRYIDATHLTSFTSGVMTLLLDTAGLQVIHLGDDDTFAIGSLAGIPRLAVRALFRLVRRLEAIGEFGRDGVNMPLGLNLIIVAKSRG